MTDRDGPVGWRADWTGTRVAVLGLEKTTFSVVDTLAELGCDVLVATDEVPEEYARLVPVVGARLIRGLRDAVGELSGFAPDAIVPSAELARDHDAVAWARRNGVAIWSDLDVAWRVRDKVLREDGTPAEWVFVTGRDGAALTSTLTASMLVADGRRAAPCGGDVPVLDAVRDPEGFDVLVVEASSRALEVLGANDSDGSPVPHSAVCLNAADDAWHGSAAATRDAQAVVYRHAKAACVYNKADELTMRMVEDADVTDGARAIGFGLGTPGPSDLGVVDGILADRAFVPNRRTSAAELATIDDLAARGITSPREVESVLAASAIARALGVEPGVVHRALTTPAH